MHEDEVSTSRETKSEASDSSAVTTVDKDTDSRHKSADDLETSENSNKNSTNLPERKQEFVVPMLPFLPQKKNKAQSKASLEQPPEEKQTEDIESAEDSEKLNNKNQRGRKRVGLDDAQENLNEETEKNVSCSFDLIVLFGKF